MAWYMIINTDWRCTRDTFLDVEDKCFYFPNCLILPYFLPDNLLQLPELLLWQFTRLLVTKWPADMLLHEKDNVQTAMFNFPPEIRKSQSLKSRELFPKPNSLNPHISAHRLWPHCFNFHSTFFFFLFKCRTANSLGKNAVKTVWVWNWTDSYSYSTYFAAFLLFRGKCNKYNRTKAWVQPFRYLQYVCFLLFWYAIFTFS